MYVLLALVSAVLLGVWRFGIGQYRGRINANLIVLISATAVTVIYVVLGTISQELTFNREDAIPGVIAGIFNVAGTLIVIKAFERGKMGVVTGVAAMEAVVPLGYSLLIGEPLTWVALIGVVLSLVGLLIFLLSRSPADGNVNASSFGVFLALAAALLWGTAIVVLDIGTRTSETGSLLISQMPQLAFTGAMVAISRSFAGLNRQAFWVIVGAGAALALGNLTFFVAANQGDIGIVSVIGSLSPIITAFLALAILKERLTRSEVAALAIVLVGACLMVV